MTDTLVKAVLLIGATAITVKLAPNAFGIAKRGAETVKASVTNINARRHHHENKES